MKKKVYDLSCVIYVLVIEYQRKIKISTKVSAITYS